MDLHLIPGAEPTTRERRAIDAVLASRVEAHDAPARAEAVREAPPERGHGPALRHLLLPCLHAAQAASGWVSPGALNHIATCLSVPPAEAFGVASFYHLFATSPAPPIVAHVCDDIACRASGAERLCRDMEIELGPPGQPSADGVLTWKRSPCLGLCEQGAAVFVQSAGDAPTSFAFAAPSARAVIETARVGAAQRAADASASSSAPQTVEPRARGLRLLARVGVVNPESLDDYRAHGGYTALRAALAMGPEGVLREVVDSKLVGRGGAAFPTGRKWEAVARSPVMPHYLVCNADESEPGTFKDRVLMEHDPFALVEAMTIAGLATGCERGYLYVRGEYPLAQLRVSKAIDAARRRGLLGDTIMGEPLRFDIEVRRGAGAYICGEETALFNSIEGYRGEPRNKPPFPVQAGLFGKPTVINNVETLVNVLDIVRDGGQRYAHMGSAASTGTKLFCVSGSVASPGVYEVPFGVTLRQVIALAGGVAGRAPLQAVLLGGAAGVFVLPSEIDMPLTFEGTKAAGATLGSGVVLVFSDAVDLADMVSRVARFFHDESCGQCVPCRVGTVRQEEALHRLATARTGAARELELQRLAELADAMRDASICGLGQTASSAVQSALRKFRLHQQEAAR